MRGTTHLRLTLLVTALMAGLASPAWAQQPTAEEEAAGAALDDIVPARREDGSRRPIRQRDLARLLDRELSIIETLESLQFQIVKKQDHLEQVQTEREQVEAELADFTTRFERETLELQTHRERIRKRLRAMRQLMRMETLYLVFSSESFTDLLRRERLLDRIVERDRDQLAAYKEALVRYRTSQEELQRRRDQLAAVERDIYQSKAAIETDRSDMEELLQRIDQERTYYEKYHEELQRRSRWIARKITSLGEWDGRTWFDSHKGRLTPPVRGASEAVGFGYRVHPRFGTKVLHRGITYRPNQTEGRSRLSVYAVYMGKVVFAGHLSGYGNAVIIDHTKGYYTLYAKLDEITVEEGEVLRTRERIGFIGNRRTLRGAELYFELRSGGRPVNPAPWFR